jgi:Na+/melibiose symporter-like transporter
VLLSLIGFVQGEGAAQGAGFEGRLFVIYILVPALGFLLALPLLRRYKLRDKDVQVMARYNSGAISREEADALLGGRY